MFSDLQFYTSVMTLSFTSLLSLGTKNISSISPVYFKVVKSIDPQLFRNQVLCVKNSLAKFTAYVKANSLLFVINILVRVIHNAYR